MSATPKKTLRRNQSKVNSGGLAAALARLQAQAQPTKTYEYKVQPPKLPDNVVPAGVVAPVMAMDYNPYSYAADVFPGGGFPGFPYLAQLATRAEYRAFASTLSTEITREWIKFTSKQDDDTNTAEKIKMLEAEFERLNVRGVIQKTAEYDTLFGRGQIFIGLAGQDRKTPLILHPQTVPLNSLERVAAVEPIWTTPAGYNALDPTAPDFYKPSVWFMLGQQIHASRLMTVITRPLPDMLKPAFNFAGMSLSQLAEPYVDNWLRTRQAVANLINNFSTTALGTAMDQILSDGDDGAANDLINRATFFTSLRSNNGLMLYDKEREEMVQLNAPLAGLHELQAQSQEHMCSVSRMPAIVLTGISPSGLNASSEGEIQVFYDWIAAIQTAFYKEPIMTILKVAQLSLFGEIDEDIGIEFVPLYQMSDKELSDIRTADANNAEKYINAGVLHPIEVRDKMAKDPTSGYMGIDVDDVPEPPADYDPSQEPPPDGLDEPPEAAQDKSVSEAQHKAMEAAAHGHSTLGIPAKVGKEYVKKDEK